MAGHSSAPAPTPIRSACRPETADTSAFRLSAMGHGACDPPHRIARHSSLLPRAAGPHAVSGPRALNRPRVASPTTLLIRSVCAVPRPRMRGAGVIPNTAGARADPRPPCGGLGTRTGGRGEQTHNLGGRAHHRFGVGSVCLEACRLVGAGGAVAPTVVGGGASWLAGGAEFCVRVSEWEGGRG